VATIPKVVGGLTPACLKRAEACMAGPSNHRAGVLLPRGGGHEAARKYFPAALNIALINELKVVYQAMGIDVWEVIQAAKTKPFGFMAFLSRTGLAAICIPIDPFYLTWKAREFSQNTRFIELAGEINTPLPLHVINRTAEALNARRKSRERQPRSHFGPGLTSQTWTTSGSRPVMFY